ncbi:hypothetical protein SAMN05428949_0526 [Chitinophaga sp. YR627]|uniref:universal stress protein n=1 Tax=Chitinophaga sp. YR627 TaxID=1881041 RepID=UPI0008EA2B34|nr:universal stress protein [Chitinophaga sp. YR627]SFM71253.1 hypothetical protein SAMN05428949_0526 [Chitinophaga sp. YR627]
MKKIVAIIDAINYKEEQLDAIEYISGMIKSTLTIIMMEDINSISTLMAPDFAEGVPAHYYEIVIKAADEKKKIIKENTAALQKACKERNIACTIRGDKGSAVEETILESRFADLLLIGRDISFPFLFDTNPTSYVRDMLVAAQCPVMVIPDNLLVPKGVIFCYNGTYSSMYAIRAFASLFPALVAKSCTVLYVCEKGNSVPPNEKLLQEYLSSYNDQVAFKILSGRMDNVLTGYLEGKSDYISTFGAYGRSRLSRFFDDSSAESILRKMKGPLFITHP